MKKFLLLFVMASFFVACNDSDEGPDYGRVDKKELIKPQVNTTQQEHDTTTKK